MCSYLLSSIHYNLTFASSLSKTKYYLIITWSSKTKTYFHI